MKKITIVVFVIGILSASFYWYVSKRMETNDSNKLLVYGNVDIRELTLGFRVPGRLDKLMLEEGERVKAGEKLAVLDKQPFIEEMDVSEAELKEVIAQLNNAERNYNRLLALQQNKAISQSDLDDALALRDQLTARKETVKARQKVLQTRLDDCTLSSPSDGIIMTRVKEAGSIVSAGSTVYSLALENPVWVRTYIDEKSLGQIYPGQTVEVSNDSGSTYQGRIGYISPQAEFTPKTVETSQLRTDLVYRVRINIINPDQFLRQGMPVTIQIHKKK